MGGCILFYPLKRRAKRSQLVPLGSLSILLCQWWTKNWFSKTRSKYVFFLNLEIIYIYPEKKCARTPDGINLTVFDIIFIWGTKIGVLKIRRLFTFFETSKSFITHWGPLDGFTILYGIYEPNWVFKNTYYIPLLWNLENRYYPSGWVDVIEPVLQFFSW